MNITKQTMNGSTLHRDIRSSFISFAWYDYVTFALMLVSSCAIGIYFGKNKKEQRTASSYLFGEKQMKFFPVAVSVAVGHFSAVSILTYPADIYKNGLTLVWTIPMYFVLAIMTIYLYMPVFIRLQVVSTFEYLEKRFDRRARLLASIFYVVYQNMFLPIAAYIPALAISAGTGINIHLVIVVTCGVCVVYTAIGGLRAVIWTDLLQIIVIMVSLVIVVVAGVHSVGGIKEVWTAASTNDKFNIFDFKLDLTKREGCWVIMIGLLVQYFAGVSSDQASVQKFLAVETYKNFVKSVIGSMMTICLVNILLIVAGLTIFAKYKDFDLIAAKKISRSDEIFPYFVVDVASGIPGVPGLFIAALVCAGLSSISSILNAVSGVVYQDFVVKIWPEEFESKRGHSTLMLLVFIQGVLCIVLSFFIPLLGDIFPVTISLCALTFGPFLGMMTLGMFSSRTNATGAFYGAICTFAILLCIYIPSKYYEITGAFQYGQEVVTVPSIFRLSFFYMTLVGLLLCIAIGYVIGLATNKNKVVADKKLLNSICHFCLFDRQDNTIRNEENEEVLKPMHEGTLSN